MAGSRGKKIFLIIIIVVFVLGVLIPLAVSFARRGGGKIGVIEVEGTITDLSDAMEDVVRFKEDDSIREVILESTRRRSMGRSGDVQRAQKTEGKEQDRLCVHGVYLRLGGCSLAAMGDKVYANPSTITGSIGVIMEQTVVEDLMKKFGIAENTIKSGLLKDAGSPFCKMTDYERTYVQNIINSIYERFVKDVSDGRRLPVKKVRNFRRQNLYGLQAKEVKLVDSIGTFYDAVDDMQKALGIKGKPTLVHGKRPFSLFKWLISSAMQDILLRTTTQPPVSFLYKP